MSYVMAAIVIFLVFNILLFTALHQIEKGETR